ncbi:YpjCB family protein [Escherichia coli]
MFSIKSNGFNASAGLGSGNYNENKSSKHMELLAHSIVKLICKEDASETYRGALETLQKMMSECIYQEGNAFVIMGAGEQLKRIKYDVDENNLKVFNVHFNNNEELVTDGEPDVVCLSKQEWENLLIKLKLENKENAASEVHKSANKGEIEQLVECSKRNEKTLLDNISKNTTIYNIYNNQRATNITTSLSEPPAQGKSNDVDKLKQTQFINASQFDINELQQSSAFLASKYHTIDIQEKTDAFVNKFKGILFDKNGRSSELLFNFYECCYKFLPRAQPQDKIASYNSALQAFSIFCSSTLTHNGVGFNFKLFPEVKLCGENLETVFKYKNGDDVREIAKINIILPKGEGDLYNLGGLDFKGCFFSGQNFSNYDIKYVNWGTSLFDVDTPCIFNTSANNESYEKSLKPVSENGLNGVLSDRNKKIKLITGVAPFDDILFMDDDFDDSSSEDNSPEDGSIKNRPLV